MHHFQNYLQCEFIFILMKFSFLLHLMLIVLELIPFKFVDLSIQIWWTIMCIVTDLDSLLFKILNSLMCALANFHFKSDYFEIFIGFIRMFKFIIYVPSHFALFYFIFYFWVNDLNLCSRLHCIALLLTTSIFYVGY